MQKGMVLKILNFMLSVPYLLIGYIALSMNLFNLRDDISSCINIVDSKCFEIPNSYLTYLIAAEDHRFKFHFGIDLIGVIRSIFKIIFYKKVQGGSTIEQQFVRVATHNYEKSYRKN